jgi:hypothetical protein
MKILALALITLILLPIVISAQEIPFDSNRGINNVCYYDERDDNGNLDNLKAEEWNNYELTWGYYDSSSTIWFKTAECNILFLVNIDEMEELYWKSHFFPNSFYYHTPPAVHLSFSPTNTTVLWEGQRYNLCRADLGSAFFDPGNVITKVYEIPKIDGSKRVKMRFTFFH